MSSVDIKLDGGTGLEYDAELATCPKTMRGDFTAATKDDGTVNGKPILIIQKDGVGFIFTVRNFLELAAIVAAKYPEEEERKRPGPNALGVIKGVHRAVSWEAILMEQVYIVVPKLPNGREFLSIAGSEDEVRGLAEASVVKALAALGQL